MMEELAVARSSREEQNENDMLADTDDDETDKEYVYFPPDLVPEVVASLTYLQRAHHRSRTHGRRQANVPNLCGPTL